MIAMRAMFSLDINEKQKYELILGKLFTPTTLKDIERHLAESYENVITNFGFEGSSHSEKAQKKYSEKAQKELGKARGDKFMSLIGAFGRLPEKLSNPSDPSIKDNVRDNSRKLLYQHFWHGLYSVKQLTTETEKDDKNNLKICTSISFESETIENYSFLDFLGQRIFEKSFL